MFLHSTIIGEGADTSARPAAAATAVHVPALMEAAVTTVLFDCAVFLASSEELAALRARRSRGRRRGSGWAAQIGGGGPHGLSPVAGMDAWLPHRVGAADAGPLLRHPEAQVCLQGMVGARVAGARKAGLQRRRRLRQARQLQLALEAVEAVDAAHSWVRGMMAEVEVAVEGCRARAAWLGWVFEKLSLT